MVVYLMDSLVVQLLPLRVQLILAKANLKISEFYTNIATREGVLHSYKSIITIEASEFFDNNSTNQRGVLYSENSTTTIGGSNFTHQLEQLFMLHPDLQFDMITVIF